MKMKRLAALLMAAGMVFSLIGCGNTAAQNQSGEPAQKKEEAQGEATGAEEPVKEAELNIMMSFPQYMDQWETYCRQFEEKMLAEKNIKVKVNLEMPSSDQYDSVLQARLSGDDAPDLFTIHSNNISAYDKAGNLTDLSAEPLAGKLYENVKETVSIDGRLLAVPIESQAWGVLYNKDIFEECGLAAPDTLEELETVCETLKEKGHTPFLLAFQ